MHFLRQLAILNAKHLSVQYKPTLQTLCYDKWSKNQKLCSKCNDPRWVYCRYGRCYNFGNSGYNGPLPPEGHGQHKYYFWIIALDAELNLPAGLTLWQLLEKIEPHATAMNRLIGTYQRG